VDSCAIFDPDKAAVAKAPVPATRSAQPRRQVQTSRRAFARPAERKQMFVFYFYFFVGAGNDPASKITSTLAFTRVPAGNRF